MSDNENIEYFQDTAGKDRFRIKGGNGEIVATSEPYTNLSNAKRGVNDLYFILLKAVGGVEFENAKDNDVHGDPFFSGRSGDEPAESADKESTQEAPEEASLPEAFSRHDDCPGDNPAELKEDPTDPHIKGARGDD